MFSEKCNSALAAFRVLGVFFSPFAHHFLPVQNAHNSDRTLVLKRNRWKIRCASFISSLLRVSVVYRTWLCIYSLQTTLRFFLFLLFLHSKSFGVLAFGWTNLYLVHLLSFPCNSSMSYVLQWWHIVEVFVQR